MTHLNINSERARNKGFGGRTYGDDGLAVILQKRDADIILLAQCLDIFQGPGSDSQLPWTKSQKLSQKRGRIEGALDDRRRDLEKLFKALDTDSDITLDAQYPLPSIDIAEVRNLSYEHQPRTYQEHAQLLMNVTQLEVERALSFWNSIQFMYKNERAQEFILNRWYKSRSRNKQLMSICELLEPGDEADKYLPTIDRAHTELLDLYQDWKGTIQKSRDDHSTGPRMFRQLTKLAKLQERLKANQSRAEHPDTPREHQEQTDRASGPTRDRYDNTARSNRHDTSSEKDGPKPKRTTSRDRRSRHEGHEASDSEPYREQRSSRQPRSGDWYGQRNRQDWHRAQEHRCREFVENQRVLPEVSGED